MTPPSRIVYIGGALLLALIHRHGTGRGREMDVSLRAPLDIGGS